MTKIELTAFREVLEGLRSEVAISNREALAVEASPDEMDRIQQFSEREYAMNHLERNSNRLREIEEAVCRMDDGTYGVCLDCEAEIKLRRLTAVPWAATCIACQEAAEEAREELGYEVEGSDAVAA